MKTKILIVAILVIGTFISFSCKKDKNKDKTAPVITIIGYNPIYTNKDSAYVDPGATATDDVDGNITSKIVVTNNVNVADTGTYQVKYNVADNAGNKATEAVRTVKVLVMK